MDADSSELIPMARVEESPAYVLHPVRGIVWAAFWGTPIAAGIVMAINYARTGSKTAARNAVAIGLATTVALFAIIFSIPESILDKIPNSAFYMPQLMLVYAVANGMQAELINQHEAHGGKLASGWPGAGIGALCLPVVLLALVAYIYVLDDSYGTLVEFGNDEVYYAGEATEADARKLARVLKDDGFFGGDGVSVRISAESGRYTVSFVVHKDTWNDNLMVEAFRDTGQVIVDTGFPTPLRVELCNDYFEAKKTLTIE